VEEEVEEEEEAKNPPSSSTKHKRHIYCQYSQTFSPCLSQLTKRQFSSETLNQAKRPIILLNVQTHTGTVIEEEDGNRIHLSLLLLHTNA